MLVQVQPGFTHALRRYTGVLEQRNALLKLVSTGIQPADALDPWDAGLVEWGERLQGWRAEAVDDLAPRAAEWHRRLSGGEELEITYDQSSDDLATAVEKSRAEDVRRGVTTVGPHRDDVGLRLGGREARGFASQGQQRTIVVSLKLAEADAIEARSGSPPVLLLDDVLSELDADRRGALFAAVAERGQVVVTSVDLGPFPEGALGRALVRCISAGEVGPCG
jgi:DNA replication and repair protein RecF